MNHEKWMDNKIRNKAPKYLTSINSSVHMIKMMSAQHLFQFQTRISHRIHVTRSSFDDGGNKHTIDQFRPLQSVFRRQLLLGTATTSLLAIGANFCGITTFLLGFSPDAARSLKLDALYPVGGYSRYIDTNLGFEFLYPESWLGDQTLLYRAAGKAERSLDPPVGGKRRNANEPVVAFGPPGSTGELNVSVIVSSVPIDFSIEAFGGAEEVGKAVVRTITGSGKRSDVKGTLIWSSVRVDPIKKIKYYELEFGVETPLFQRHNVAVLCCAQNGRLFTLNAQVPEDAWPQFKTQFYAIAHSFHSI
ncbi:PsbP domain-containing protein 7, chloroplastic [Castilleja foliolosa]|uniref:PsbP domain-containing protein 7, chloroplastic n=1 Tax=Castilleja foliolosa TaxID=1961234 RepID=A0ABD3CK33_9LAMI